MNLIGWFNNRPPPEVKATARFVESIAKSAMLKRGISSVFVELLHQRSMKSTLSGILFCFFSILGSLKGLQLRGYVVFSVHERLEYIEFPKNTAILL